MKLLDLFRSKRSKRDTTQRSSWETTTGETPPEIATPDFNELFFRLCGKEIVDLRSVKEKEIAEDAAAGTSLGFEVDLIVTELIAIGTNEGFVGKPGGSFSERGNHMRARSLGILLNEMGGQDLMLSAHYRVRFRLGHGRTLEAAWDGIGEWES